MLIPFTPLKGEICLLEMNSRHVVSLTIYCLLVFLNTVSAQQYDLLIKNGHVIDPKNGINAKKDIAVAGGKIVKVDNDISAGQSKKIIDAKGLYVVPGLIDIHTHVFCRH